MQKLQNLGRKLGFLFQNAHFSNTNGIVKSGYFYQIKVKSDRNMNKHIGLEEEMSRLNDRISEAAHGVQRNVLIFRILYAAYKILDEKAANNLSRQ